MGDEEKPQVDHLNLKVVTQDGNEIFYKCAAVPPPPAALPDLRASRCATAEIFAAHSHAAPLLAGARRPPRSASS